MVKLKSKKIMCIGEILWDALPEGLFLGGAPFNVACHLKMLNENVVMLSRVGNDVLGNQAVKRLVNKKLTKNFIQIDKKYQTGIVEVRLDQNGNAEYEIVQPVAWDFITSNSKVVKEAETCDIIVFGTLAQRNETTRKTISELLKLDKINIYDVNLRPPFIDQDIIEKSLKAANIIKLNDDEFMQMAEWFDFPSNLNGGIKYFAQKFNCETVCITKGARGAVIYRNGKITEHHGFKIKTKDTVGSGDAFLAAFIHGIIQNYKNDEILKFANAVGAFVATRNGATPNLDFNKINKLRLN